MASVPQPAVHYLDFASRGSFCLFSKKILETLKSGSVPTIMVSDSLANGCCLLVSCLLVVLQRLVLLAPTLEFRHKLSVYLRPD